MKRKFIQQAFALSFASLLLSGTVQAQQFPSKPIKLIVGFTAGGGADTLGRVYAQKLSEILKTPVIVENKPGAYEAIAAQSILNSPPDGHTIWLTTTISLVTAPATKDVPYDPAKSFTHLGKVAEVDAVFIAKKDLPVNTLGDLLKYAKDNPTKVSYASAGVGSPNHLIPEYLLAATGGKATHIPYKGDGDVTREVAAGTVDFALAVAPIVAPFINDGRIRGLAVTAEQPIKALPNVRSVTEEPFPEAKSLGVYAFYAFIAPGGVPAGISKTLSDAIVAATNSAEIKQRLEGMSFRPAIGSADDVRKIIEKDVPKWREVARKVGV
jgi:tripartite-type tricarboxylate transporter receptor subunit TctC